MSGLNLSSLKRKAFTTKKQIDDYKTVWTDTFLKCGETVDEWYSAIQSEKRDKKLERELKRKILTLNSALRTLADSSLSLQERINRVTPKHSAQNPFTSQPMQSKPIGSNQRGRAREVPRHRSLPLG